MDPGIIPLGPAEYIFTGAGSQPITFAFHYANPLDLAALRKSLTETLGFFPLLQSRLIRSGENDYAYQITEEGLIFDVAKSDQSFIETKDIRRYITPVNSLEENPLTRITVTHTPDGSVLGVSISHALADGYSYFHFLSSWARACRGERFLPPDMNRQGLFPPSETGGEAVTRENLLDHCGLFLAEKRDPCSAGSTVEERILISKDELKGRIEEAKKDSPGAMLSDNDVITAWLWKNTLPGWIHKTSRLETYLTCPVDCRRIFKAIPKNYFGCAVCFVSASADYSTLLSAPIGKLALRVHEAVRKVNHDFVSRSMDTLERFRSREGIAAMEKIHLRHPSSGLIVTNLTRMPVRDLDFGSGAPADFLIHSDVSASAALLPAENGIEAVVLHPSSPL
jgi:shikimate O-hydroxycinnamoyltransferase